MKYKATVFPAVEAGNPSIEFKFETLSELESGVNSMADLLIFMQDKAKVMDDFSNFFVREILVDSEWIDMDDYDGE